MNTSKGVQLVRDFTKALNTQDGIKIISTNLSRNIFEFNGKCLLYIKGRAEYPYRWGVTANVIERLNAQSKKWVVILLFESYEKGYLLSSKDVEYYIQDVWPLGADGDYKPASGSYLARNTSLIQMHDFIKAIEMNIEPYKTPLL